MEGQDHSFPNVRIVPFVQAGRYDLGKQKRLMHTQPPGNRSGVRIYCALQARAPAWRICIGACLPRVLDSENVSQHIFRYSHSPPPFSNPSRG